MMRVWYSSKTLYDEMSHKNEKRYDEVMVKFSMVGLAVSVSDIACKRL